MIQVEVKVARMSQKNLAEKFRKRLWKLPLKLQIYKQKYLRNLVNKQQTAVGDKRKGRSDGQLDGKSLSGKV